MEKQKFLERRPGESTADWIRRRNAELPDRCSPQERLEDAVFRGFT